jgi:hypothetical protein
VPGVDSQHGPCEACSGLLQAVLVPSEQLPEDAVTIRGWDFNHGSELDDILGSMLQTGLQATALGQAIDEVNRMVRRCLCGWVGQGEVGGTPTPKNDKVASVMMAVAT